MCYLNKREYRIIPTSSYPVLRGCPGCGARTTYVSTGNFRVNANGRRIDVWLVYQCGKCRHTYNLAIHERVRPEDIPGEEYRRFLENDEETALRYGTDKSVFARNRAEIDWECISYEILPIKEVGNRTGEREGFGQNPGEGSMLVIDNPFELKIRTDKAVAEIVHLSRSKVRQLVKAGKLEFPQDYVGRRIVLELGQTDWGTAAPLGKGSPSNGTMSAQWGAKACQCSEKAKKCLSDGERGLIASKGKLERRRK